MKVAVNLIVFAGVCAVAGITGWLLGLLIIHIGGTQ